MTKVLVLGGTSEARTLAEMLDGDPRIDVVTSLAGRVRELVLPQGETRVGGFGGADGLAEWIARESVDVLVDATHPFAAQISVSARVAADASRIPLVQLIRPSWLPEQGDSWTPVSSTDEAATLVESVADRAFLTIGRQGVGSFARNERTWFLVRSIDAPGPSIPPNHELLLARGPFETTGEKDLMVSRGIDVLVSKNSGGAMTEAKLAAARDLGIPVVMIARPPVPPGDHVAGHAADVAAWLRSRLRRGTS